MSEMSEFHKATNILFKGIKSDPYLTEQLDILENTTRRMHELLRLIIASSALSYAPESILQRLRDLEVLAHDDAHEQHIRILTTYAEDLNHPQKALPFFDKYSGVLPKVVQHDILASQLVADVLLWRDTLMTTTDLQSSIDKYREITPPWLLS